MNLLRILSILTTLISAFTVGYVWVNYNSVVVTCSSSFYQEYDLSGVHLVSEMNSMTSTSRSHHFYTNIEGNIILNGKIYHLNRMQDRRYKAISKNAGILNVTLLKESKSSGDTMQGPAVNIFLVGNKLETLTSRFLRLDHNVLLIGNAYSPLYSCVRVGK